MSLPDHSTCINDQPPIEQAIAKLLQAAEQAGLSADDLIQMLHSGVTLTEILTMLEQELNGQVQ